MNRLLYSPSSTSLKINPNPSLLLLRFGRIDSVKFNFPLPTRRGLRPLGLFSYKNEKPSVSSIPCRSSSNSSSDSICLSDSSIASPEPDLLEHFAGKDKVKKSLFVASALALSLIQPIFAPAVLHLSKMQLKLEV